MPSLLSERNTRLPSGYAEDFVNAVVEDLPCGICFVPENLGLRAG